jgi:small subunit ribosomal protein S18
VSNNRKRRPIAAGTAKPKANLFAELGIERVDYKDVATLRRFLSASGKIRARRVTGLSPQQQRQVATAVRNAREMALLPYGPGPA